MLRQRSDSGLESYCPYCGTDTEGCDHERIVRRQPEEPEMCPMGCGRTTDDVAGGPCSECWKVAPR